MLYICKLSNKFDLNQTIRVSHKSVVMLSVVYAYVVFVYSHAECSYVKCHYPECRYAECFGALVIAG